MRSKGDEDDEDDDEVPVVFVPALVLPGCDRAATARAASTESVYDQFRRRPPSPSPVVVVVVVER